MLGKIRDVLAVEPLLRALTDAGLNYSATELPRNPNHFLREAIIKAVGEIKDQRAIEPIKIALTDRVESVRQAAKEALEKLKY
jgi:HEAT repeat protein